MPRGRNTLTARIALEGGKEIKRELESLGPAGTKAFRQLEQAANKLKEPTDRATKSLANLQKRLETLGTKFQQVGQRMNQLGRQFSLFVSAPIIAGFGGAIKAAADFESAMADVRKVVDFPTPEAFTKLGEDLVTLSGKVPGTASELANIAAAAGQAGIPFNELADFVELVSKAMVTLDIPIDQAGTQLANLRTALGLTTPDLALLADAINTLSNNFNANGAQVLDFVNRVGALGDVVGVLPKDVAAIGAAMIGAGADAERASTGFRNILLTLASGEEATPGIRDALEKLGLTAVGVAKRVQKEGVGVIFDIFNRIQKQAPEVQASIIEGLFGRRVVDAAAPLINNLGSLSKAIDLVKDSADFKGSLDEEFAIRMDTFTEQFGLLKDAVIALGIAFGNDLLPVARQIVSAVTNFVNAIANAPAPIRYAAEAIALLVAAVGPLLIALGTLVQVVGFALGGLSTLVGTISAFGASAGIAGASIATLVRIFGIWPAIIYLVVTALSQLLDFIVTLAGYDWEVWKEAFRRAWTYLVELVDTVVDQIQAKWQAFIDWFEQTALGRLLDYFGRIINKAREALNLSAQAGAAGGSTPPPAALAKGTVGIVGPGTTTSDSIPSLLSRGESVITAAATATNRGLLRMMNAFPRIDFASLLAQQPLRLAAGMVPEGSSGTVNLNLGLEGQQFPLRADADVAASMMRYARQRSRLNAGRRPSWYK